MHSRGQRKPIAMGRRNKERSNSKDEEYDLDEINAFNTYYDNIKFVYQEKEGVEDTDEENEEEKEEYWM